MPMDIQEFHHRCRLVRWLQTFRSNNFFSIFPDKPESERFTPFTIRQQQLLIALDVRKMERTIRDEGYAAAVIQAVDNGDMSLLEEPVDQRVPPSERVLVDDGEKETERMGQDWLDETRARRKRAEVRNLTPSSTSMLTNPLTTSMTVSTGEREVLIGDPKHLLRRRTSTEMGKREIGVDPIPAPAPVEKYVYMNEVEKAMANGEDLLREFSSWKNVRDPDYGKPRPGFQRQPQLRHQLRVPQPRPQPHSQPQKPKSGEAIAGSGGVVDQAGKGMPISDSTREEMAGPAEIGRQAGKGAHISGLTEATNKPAKVDRRAGKETPVPVSMREETAKPAEGDSRVEKAARAPKASIGETARQAGVDRQAGKETPISGLTKEEETEWIDVWEEVLDDEWMLF